MRFIQADIIYPISSKPVKNGIIVLDAFGTIHEILKDETEIDPLKLEKYQGSVCPGFINAHCHLELSHLKGVIPQKEGLVEFAKVVVSQRNGDLLSHIEESMRQADADMRKAGIVAVGDISNGTYSFLAKQNSGINYHTFIELIGLNPQNADKIMLAGEELMQEAKHKGLNASFVPHAPYSTSYEVMRMIAEISSEKELPICIHNQESKEENNFFETKTGNFIELYKGFNLPIDYFEATGKTSLQSYLVNLKKAASLMLVHNTFSNSEDVTFAKKEIQNLFWCLCPKANLYIEDTLPDVNLLISNNCKITIGTDSLASNDSLDIMSELRVLKQNFPSVTTEQMLQWATLNGAQFLRIDEEYGSLEKGKSPGLVLIDEEKMEVKRVL